MNEFEKVRSGEMVSKYIVRTGKGAGYSRLKKPESTENENICYVDLSYFSKYMLEYTV